MCEENKANDEAQPKQELPEFKVAKKPDGEEQKSAHDKDHNEESKIQVEEDKSKEPKIEEFKYHSPG